MVDLPMAPIVPAGMPGNQKTVGQMPTDAMQSGIHSDIRVASKHKKMVSPVLHLKKESAGHRGNPSAFNIGHKAFPKQKFR